MSFREQVSSEIEEAASNNEREELDQIDVDFESTPFVKFTPTSLLAGTFPEDEGNPIILLRNQQRLSELGDAAQDDRGNDLRFTSTRYLGIVLDDVHPHDDDEFDDVALLKTEDDNTDYRIFDLSDEDTKETDIGIKFGDRLYEGEVVDETIDRAIVVVDRTASVNVARRLDVNGAEFAGMDEETGRPNGGLIEYAPDDEDTAENRRYARPFVELREELYGAEVGIMVTRRSEHDEDFAERVADEGDSTQDMYWYSVFNLETGDAIEPTTGDPVSYSFLQWNFDPTAGHLPDEDWTFVTEYVESGMPTDEDTILQNIEDNSDQLSDDPNTDRMVRLIQSDAGQ